jgi:hypothetical protein
MRGQSAKVNYPDIQLTCFPRVTEPHLVTRESNATSAGSGAGAERERSMLVTIALLDPEARYRWVKQSHFAPARIVF